MPINIVPFCEDHFDRLIAPAIAVCAVREGKRFFMTGPAFSSLCDGRLVGCAGIATLWRGSGEAWAVLTPDVPKIVHRTISARFQAILQTGLYRRVQANVLATFDTAVRWVQRLGFVEESRMPLFGPNGETYIRYVIFPRH